MDTARPATRGLPHHQPVTAITGLFTHPLVVASTAGLVVNDHWAKRSAPSWVTGKASDAFGAILLTVLGVTLVVMANRWRGRVVAPDRRLATGVAVVVVACVTLVKTSEVGAGIGGAVLGVAGWPLGVLASLATNQSVGDPTVAQIIIDPFDAVAALAAFVVLVILPATPRDRTRAAEPSQVSA